jgi:DNA polymerase-4
MRRYREKSAEVMAIFSDFTPDVLQISVDEAFLDITGTEKLFGPPALVGAKLKRAVREKTGLTVSLGVASNRYVAKIASGISKPDGITLVEAGEEEAFMGALPVTKIWGAGNKTQEQFKKQGFKTCADIRRLTMKNLQDMFGEAFGLFLYRAVRGEAAQAFDRGRLTHSMSAERTFPYDLYDEFAIETALFEICETLIFRLLDQNWRSKTVSIKIRYDDFSTEGAQETLSRPVSGINDLFDHLSALLRKKRRVGRGVRLIGAGLMNLETGDVPRQGELFDESGEKERALDKYILEINKRFPGAALRRGRSLMADGGDE